MTDFVLVRRKQCRSGGALPSTQSPDYTIIERERIFEHQRRFSVSVPRAAAAA
jgi:hypothetical protein